PPLPPPGPAVPPDPPPPEPPVPEPAGAPPGCPPLAAPPPPAPAPPAAAPRDGASDVPGPFVAPRFPPEWHPPAATSVSRASRPVAIRFPPGGRRLGRTRSGKPPLTVGQPLGVRSVRRRWHTPSGRATESVGR